MTYGKSGKTKQELYELRKQMMKPKSKPKLEVVDQFIDMNNSMKRGNTELMSRLAQGSKTNIDPKESKSRSKNMYNKLPEQKMKQDEKKKQQDLIERQKKMQEYAHNLRMKN